MYNLKTRVIPFVLSAIVIAACQDINIEEVSPAEPKADVGNLSATSFSGIYDTVKLHRVDLYMMRGSSAAGGTVRVQIIGPGGVLLTSSELPVESIPTASSWVTFDLTTSVRVIGTHKYRIEVTRSNPPVGGTGFVYWRVARTNPYPAGVSDLSAANDYAFRTYTNGEVDQEQPVSTTVFPVTSIAPRWQEFVVDTE